MPKTASKKIVIAYVPVIHRGYIQFFKAQTGVNEIWVINEELQKRVDYLRKDLRRLKSQDAIKTLKALFAQLPIQSLGPDTLSSLDKPEYSIVMPDEDLSHEVASMLSKAKVSFFPVFLRWDRQNIAKGINNASFVKPSQSKRDKTYMELAYKNAALSADIWRKVGAVLADENGVVAEGRNTAEPATETPWIEGDPRNLAKQGQDIELSLFTHAESLLVAEAAKNGTKLEGKTLYVTTFPCPVCAKLVAHSGIKRLCFSEGYAVLDGQRTLTAYGVNIVKVEVPNSFEHASSKVPYNK
jgi:dCMP deaminase